MQWRGALMKAITIHCALFALALAAPASADEPPAPKGSFLSSLKQSFREDYQHEVVRGHFDVGASPNAHRYYCLLDPKTGKVEEMGVAGTPTHRRDGTTGIEGASVSLYSCVDADAKGQLVTADYRVTLAPTAKAAPATAAAPAPAAAAAVSAPAAASG